MNDRIGRPEALNYSLGQMWVDFWSMHPIRRIVSAWVAMVLWVFLQITAALFVPMARPWRIAVGAAVWTIAVGLYVRRRYSN